MEPLQDTLLHNIVIIPLLDFRNIRRNPVYTGVNSDFIFNLKFFNFTLILGKKNMREEQKPESRKKKKKKVHTRGNVILSLRGNFPVYPYMC